jgi:hypothetical protein
MYAKVAKVAKVAKEICNASGDPNKTGLVVKDICGKLEQRQPTREQFVTDFIARFVLTESASRDSRLVRYVLLEILRYKQPTAKLDLLTIEHILPQSAIKAGTATEEEVGSIGNLILVSNEVNTHLGNAGFADKKVILANSGAPYDIGGVLEQLSWGPAEIHARARYLGELAYDLVWKLPV